MIRQDNLTMISVGNPSKKWVDSRTMKNAGSPLIRIGRVESHLIKNADSPLVSRENSRMMGGMENPLLA